ncbi:hypothetical protein AVEN_230948-1 [Araneus ventricosus]|uniref:Uncharacterized protein n=1 Tax=Araneus ventricosus TaxID=182803 RepID=A0A4Y2A3B6_ARAVE|nr:hypothetical protein AVEN_230948-1 [Araneus ventricosus]
MSDSCDSSSCRCGLAEKVPIAYKLQYPGHNWDQNPGLTAASGNQIYSRGFGLEEERKRAEKEGGELVPGHLGLCDENPVVRKFWGAFYRAIHPRLDYLLFIWSPDLDYLLFIWSLD